MTYKIAQERAHRRYRLFKKATNKESENDFFELTILSVQLIFEKLREIAEEQKENAEVWNWWLNIKSDRIDGEVLSYLSDIRNSVMHGLDYEHFQLSLTSITVAFKKPVHLPEGGTITQTLDNDGCLKISIDGKGFEDAKLDLLSSNFEFQQTPKKLKTKRAKKLGLMPPIKHLGEELKNRTIHNLISIALNYYANKIEELNILLIKTDINNKEQAFF
jgi:hypothetical protein